MWEQRKLKFDMHVTTAWCILYLLNQYELSYENENMFVIIHSGLSISCTWNLPSTWSARMNLNMRYLRTIARAPELVHSSLWFCIHREDSKQFFIYSTQIDLFFFRIWFDFFFSIKQKHSVEAIFNHLRFQIFVYYLNKRFLIACSHFICFSFRIQRRTTITRGMASIIREMFRQWNLSHHLRW